MGTSLGKMTPLELKYHLKIESDVKQRSILNQSVDYAQQS